LSSPEVEWRSFFALGVPSGEYRGPEGLRQYLDDLAEAWGYLRPEVASVLEVGSVVIAVGQIRYRGKGSGAESEAPAGWLFKFRNGRLIRFRAFREPEQALEAVGLRE
jgi:ketosteroid isomerase-like protein